MTLRNCSFNNAPISAEQAHDICVILAQIKILCIQSVMIEARILQVCSFTFRVSFQIANALVCIL